MVSVDDGGCVLFPLLANGIEPVGLVSVDVDGEVGMHTDTLSLTFTHCKPSLHCDSLLSYDDDLHGPPLVPGAGGFGAGGDGDGSGFGAGGFIHSGTPPISPPAALHTSPSSQGEPSLTDLH